MRHSRFLLLLSFSAATVALFAQSGGPTVSALGAETDSSCPQVAAARKPSPKVKYNKIPLQMIDTTRVIDRIAALISSNEGNPTTIEWNDAGKGVSVGMFQANQKVGQLPDLLHKMATDEQGRTELQQFFGPQVTQKLAAGPDIVKTMAFKPNNGLGKGLQQLAKSETFQKLQIEDLRQRIAKAQKLANKHGIKSAAGVALTADLANQWGETGADKWLGCHPKTNSEMVRLNSIIKAVATASKYGSRYHGDMQKAVANGLSFTEPFVAPELPEQTDVTSDAPDTADASSTDTTNQPTAID